MYYTFPHTIDDGEPDRDLPAFELNHKLKNVKNMIDVCLCEINEIAGNSSS